MFLLNFLFHVER